MDRAKLRLKVLVIAAGAGLGIGMLPGVRVPGARLPLLYLRNRSFRSN